MNKIWCFLCICLGSMAFGENSFTQNLSFQGQLHLKKQTSYPKEIRIRAVLLDFKSADTLYKEDHKVYLDKNGVFNLLIGSGTPVQGSFADIDFLRMLSLVIFVEVDGKGPWLFGGKSGIYPVPYANATASAADSAERFNSVKVSKNLMLISKEDTILTITEQDSLGTGGCTQPWLSWSMGPNQRMYFFGTEADPEKSALLSLHWTIESSKPALVMYDKNFVRHYAVVAHYWSHSGREHQHISMEVDDSLGAVQTRFEFPWGKEKIDVESHSADFRISDGGSLLVGEGIEDTARGIIYKDLWVMDSLQIGSMNQESDSAMLWKIKELDKDAMLRLWQENGASEAAISLVRGKTNWSIAHANKFSIQRGKKIFCWMNSEGEMGIGGEPSSGQAVSIAGSMNANGSIFSTGGSLSECRLAESDFASGEVVGIDTLTGKVRSMKKGDVFLGIASSVDASAVCLNYDGASNAKVVAILGLVSVKSDQVQVVDGKVYTLYGDYIGIKQVGNYVILIHSR
ncbi:MAG: hypothetical protein RRX93_03795 [Bacteroidales bacterium]